VLALCNLAVAQKKFERNTATLSDPSVDIDRLRGRRPQAAAPWTRTT